MRKIVFDTCILSRTILIKKGICFEEVWNSFLDEMDIACPGFSKEKFIWISTSANNLEVIGLGKIREKKKINWVFQNGKNNPLRNLVVENEWKIFYGKPEEFIEIVRDRIKEFIIKELSPRNIYRQTLAFERNFPSHINSHFIMGKIKRWSKKIKINSDEYDYFFRDIFWDSIFRYPFIDLNKIEKNEHLNAMRFWGQILGLLFKEYHEMYSINLSLESSSLGLFAEIDRIESLYNGTTQERGFEAILGRWDDIFDADTIHLALIGKRKNLNTNEPLTIVTGDQRKDVENRLECLYKNIKEMEVKGLKITICPGEIIFFDLKTMQYDSKLIVQDFINAIDNDAQGL